MDDHDNPVTVRKGEVQVQVSIIYHQVPSMFHIIAFCFIFAKLMRRNMHFITFRDDVKKLMSDKKLNCLCLGGGGG